MEKLVLKKVARFFRDLFSARKIQRIWTKDWVLKFVSLLLATVLWYFVGGEDTVDKNVTVPIEIINLPRDLVISNQFKKDIEVTVSGPRSVITEMTNRAVTRQINLSNATPGTNVVENDNDSIPVPRGITVLRIQPSSIILSLDKLIQKQFQVMPVTTGDVAAGYELEQMNMSPDVITITGPQTILSHVDALLTDIIDINGMKDSRQLQVPLDLDSTIVDLIGETSVTADIVIQPKMVERKINSIPVEAYVGGAKREVAPKTVDVIARIPVLLIRQGKDINTLFSVGAVADDDSAEFLDVSVVPGEDIELPVEVVSVIPKAVKLVGTNESSKTKKSRSKQEKEKAVKVVPQAETVSDAVLPEESASEIDDTIDLEQGETDVKTISVRKNKIKHTD
jgi:hypothetical protein